MPIQTIFYNPKNYSNVASFPLKQNKNNGITNIKNGMPQKFQNADGCASFAIGRNQYVNANSSNNINLKELYAKQKPSCSYVIGRQMNSACVRGGKPFNIESADQHIQKLKNQAIGKGSMPDNKDNNSTKLSFKPQSSVNYNTIKSAVRRCRSGGCVAPAKKGARPVF